MILSFGKRTALTDSQIIYEIKRRNERVTELFYDECKKYFMSSYRAVFSREDIKEDIFQQSFVKLWTEIETGRIWLGEDDVVLRYDRRGNVRQLTCKLKSFLLDIAKNDYRDWVRGERLTLMEDYESLAHTVEVKLAVVQDEPVETLQEQIVANCVYDLPPRCKEILTMFYYKGMTLDEILEARGEKNISKNGLKSGKYKCMELLKSKVREQCRYYHIKCS